MSRCVSPWDCQCSEVDTLEPLKCWPCKKCEKKAIDMRSTLLLGSSGMSKEVSYQALEEGENQHSVKQVRCITKSMGPIKNGQSNESRGELKVTASNPLVDSLSCMK